MMFFRKFSQTLVSCIVMSPLVMELAQASQEVVVEGGGDRYRSLAAAFAISFAVFGGAMGQAKTATAAVEGIARNPAAQPKIFLPLIIGLALIESLVLYAFVIAFFKI